MEYSKVVFLGLLSEKDTAGHISELSKMDHADASVSKTRFCCERSSMWEDIHLGNQVLRTGLT